MQVREAGLSDSAELARLRWESRDFMHADHSRSSFLRECEAWMRGALESGRWVVAVSESQPDELTGCMFLQCVDKVPEPGSQSRAWGYVTNAWVDARVRGQGTGQELLRMLIDAARVRRLELLLVWPSAAAVSLYTRAGFQSVHDVHRGDDDEAPLEMYIDRDEDS